MGKSGTVVVLTGKAWARGADGSLRELSVGDKVTGDETLVLAAGATVSVNYSSGTGTATATDAGGEVVTYTAPENSELSIAPPSQDVDQTVLPDLVRMTKPDRQADDGDGAESGQVQSQRAGDGHRFVQIVRVSEDPETDAVAPLNLVPIRTDVQPMTIEWADEPQEEIEWPYGEGREDDIPPNRAPEAASEVRVIQEDEIATGNVLENDADPENRGLSVTQFQVNGQVYQAGQTATIPSVGTIVIHADGSYSFTPVADWSGTVPTIAYTVSDDREGTATSTLDITVEPAADIEPDAVTTHSGVPITVNVLENDTFENGDAKITAVTQGQHGTVVINPDGTITYTPNEGYVGPDSYTYTVTSGGITETTTVTIDVANMIPEASPEIETTPEDTPLSGNVLDNESDADGDPLTVTQFEVAGEVYQAGETATIPGIGTLVISSSGEYTFTPAANWNGAVPKVTYTVSDGNQGGSTTSTLDISVTPVNDAPVAVATLSGQVSEDAEGGISVDVAAAFADADASDTLTYTATGLPAGLSLDPATGRISGTLDPSASQGGTPGNPAGVYTVVVTAADGHGGTVSQSFTWTVTNPGPDAADDAVTTDEDTPLLAGADAGVLGNDSDPDGDALVVNAVNGAAGNVGAAVAGSHGGTFTLNADGSYIFDPNGQFADLAAGETRTTSITYTVSDGEGGTDTATLVVTVTGSNDAPITVATLPGQVSVDAEGGISVDVAAAFADADASDTLTYTATGLPAGLSLDPATGRISGTLDPSASQGGTPGNPAGVYTVVVTAADGHGGTVSQSFTWTVTNPGPDAADDAVSTDEDTPLLAGADAGVLGNDSDPDGDALVVNAVNGAAGNVGATVAGSHGGSFTLNADGSYIFDPNGQFADLAAGETRTTSITYTVSDGEGGTDTATLVVTVTGSNDAPVAVDDTNATTEDTSLMVSADAGVLGNDSDPEGDALVVDAVNGATGNVGAAVTGSHGGTFTLNADGSYIFDPNGQFADLAAGETRTTSITYTISDGEGGTDTATLVVTVTGSNDAPITVATLPGQVSVDAEGGISVDVAAAFADADASDTLTYTATGLPAGLSLDPATGRISGTLDPSASQGGTPGNPAGVYTVVVTAADGHGGTVSQSFTWTVTNPGPDAADDAVSTDEDTPLLAGADAGVLGNDSDPDGDALVVNAVNGAAGNVGAAVAGSHGGTFTLNADGSYIFDPNGQFADLAAGETRTTSITYTVSDGEGGTDTATLVVTVTGSNDAPITVATLPGQVSEDAEGGISVDVAAAFADADASDTLTYTATGLPAGLSLDPATGRISGTLDPSASQGGTPGNPAGVYTVVVTAADGHGGTVSQSFTWTVTNPGPDAADDAVTTDEDTPLLAGADAGVLGNDSDPDGDALVVNAVNGVAGNVGAAVTGSHGGTFTLNADGSYIFDPNGQFADLAAGETRTTSITYTVSDGEGGTDTATLVVTVTGSNDAPVAVDDTNATTEDTSLMVSAVGVLGNDSDPEGDALVVNAVNGATGNVGAAVTGSHGGSFTLNADGSYIFDPNGQFADLAAGETRTTSITYTISDGEGGTDTATLVVTVTGSNDAPITVATLPGQVSVDAEGGISVDVAAAFADADASDTLTYTATGLPAGLSLDPATGRISGTLDPSASQGGTPGNPAGVYTVVVTAADGHGGTVSQSFTWTVTNPGPDAKADQGSVTEDGPNLVVSPDNGVIKSGDAAAGTDIDPDGDNLTVTHVVAGTASGMGDFSGAANAGTQIAGTYGTLTLNADGSYTYVLNNAHPAVNALDPASAPLHDVFSYAISDGEGGTAFTTLTISINGNDDGIPSITPADGNGLDAGQVTVYESALTADGPGGESEVATGTITIAAGNGVASVAIGGTTLTLAQLESLSGGSPVEIDTPQGKLTLTGYVSSGEIGGVSTGGTLSYTYTLESPVNNPDPASSNRIEDISLSVTDAAGETRSSNLGINIIDDAPSVGTPTSTTVDEANLAAGTDPNAGALTQTGSLDIRIGADNTSVSTVLNSNQMAPVGLTSGGVQVVYEVSGDGHTLTARAGDGGPVVFTVTLTNPGLPNAGYDFVLSGPLDHNGSGIDLSFGFTVTDADGDAATGNFQVSVVDDAPNAVDQSPVSLEEGGDEVSSEIGGANLLGNDQAGSDGVLKVTSITYTNEAGDSATAVVTAGGVTVDTRYGSLTVNPDGTWSYISDMTENNPSGVSESFSYTVTDNDGSTSTATQQLSVTDTSPSVTPVSLSLDEQSIPGTGSTGTPSNEVTTDLPITKGADSISDVVFNGSTVSALEAQNLTSGGTALVYTLSGDGHTLTATAGPSGPVVFTLTMNNPTDGTGTNQSVTMTLSGKLDHATANGENSLSIPVGYTIHDTDSSSTATLNLTVVDDVPTAHAGTGVSVVEGGQTVTGTSLLANDVQGADGARVYQVKYTNESGVETTATVAAGPSGSTFNTIHGSLTVRQDGTWSFTSDPASTTTPSVAHPKPGSDLSVDDIFQYNLIDGDGDVSGFVSQTVTVNDTAPSIGTPASDTVNEANLPGGTDPNAPALTQTGTLAIVKGADSINVTFNQTQAALEALGLKSGGTDLVYTVSPDGHTLTAKAGASGPVVFTATIENPTAANASYSFVLSRPLDHPNVSEIQLPIAYGVTDADGDTAGSNVIITIVDDEPQSDRAFSINEDGGNITFNTSADASSSNLSASDPAYGSVTVNPNGTITYVPDPNFSGIDTFTYTTTADDGSERTTTVTVTVNPVSDAPQVPVDAGAVQTNEDVAVSLGLNAPVVTDATDQNGAGTAGDNPELLGAITLTGIPAGATLLDGSGNVLFTSTGDPITIQLSDGSHISDLTTNLTISTATYEGLQILPPSESHSNFVVTVSVTSYEVGDDKKPIAGVPGATTATDVNVNVQAVTDPIDLALVDGNDADTSETDHTFAEDTTFNLSDLLSVSFGNTDGNATTDVDGSEHRWFEISGLPIGTTVNGVTVTAENPVITVAAPGLSTSASGLPAMNITPPANFSGDVTIAVKLIAQDRDSDGIGSGATTGARLEDSVTLDLHITPVGGDVAASDVSTTEDTAVAFLSGVRVTDSGADGSEVIETVEFEVPSGWVVTDTVNGTGYEAELVGSTYTITFDGSLTEAQREAVLDGFTIKPPSHGSVDQTINVKVTTKDSVSIDGGTSTDVTTKTLPVTVTVTPVAETVGGDSNADSTPDVTMTAGHSYMTAGEEDAWFNLGTEGGFNLKDGWTNQDADEEVYARLTPELVAGDGGASSAIGSQFRYSTNGITTEEGGAWETVTFTGNPINIPVEYLDTLQFKGPANLSGSFKIKVETYTVDIDPETGTRVEAVSGSAELSNLVLNPAADEVTMALNARATGLEDTDIPLDVRPTSSDPSETFTVTISKIPAGAELYYDGVLQTQTSGSVTIANFDSSKTLVIRPPLNSNEDFTLDVSAHSVDGSDVSQSQELSVNVSLKGVADVATLTPADTTYSEAALDSGSDQVLLKEVVTTSLYDGDGSEVLTLRVTGLPEGFSLSEGTMLVSGTGTERVWVLTQQQYDTAIVKTPANFSGTQTFTVMPVTTENDGDSLTGSPQTVEIVVTPSTEASVTNSATLNEDALTPLGLGIVHGNGDTDEALTTVWIAVDAADSPNFTLYLGSTKLSEAGLTVAEIDGQNYYVLTGNQIAQLGAKGAANLDGSLGSFNFKYEITDENYGSTPAGTSTKTVHDGTFTLTANPVTDLVDVSITDISGNAGTTTVSDQHEDDDADPDSATLTNGDLVTVTLNVAKMSDPASAGGTSDSDGSEKVIRVVIEDVPDGVSVQGAEYNGNGTWLLIYDGTDALPINSSGGINLPVVFNVSGFAGNLNGVPITIEVQTQDRGDQASGTAVVSDKVTWHLTTNFPDGEAQIPARIDQWNYNGAHAAEDAEFLLSDVVDGQVTIMDASVPNTFTVSLSEVPAGTIIEGMRMTVVNGQEVWTAAVTVAPGGDGNAALQGLLDSIKITTPANSNENNGTGAFHLDASLTVSVPSGGNDTAVINDMTVPVDPVTDAADISISAPAIDEGVESIPVTITVSNTADGAYGEIIDGKLYVRVDAGGSTNGLENGTLTYNGSELTTELVNGVEYYVVNGVTAGTPINLVYTPDNSTAGQVSFSTLVRTQESNSSQVVTTTETGTAQVVMINNGVTVASAPSSGNESSQVQINGLVVSLIDNDGSEAIKSILLSNVPNGFLVYVGDSAGTATLASNAGGDNTWVISNPDGSLPAYVAIVPPEHWSGTLDGLTVLVESGESAFNEGKIESFELGDVTVNPVADGIDLTATNTFGSENQVISLNLNASMADPADASVAGAPDANQEMTTLKLTGLGAFASFYIGGAERITGVSYDAGTDTYTLTGLTQSDLDQLGFLQARNALTDQDSGTSGVQIRAEAFTTDGTSTSTSDTVNLTVNSYAQLPTSGDDTLLWTGNAINAGSGDDTILLRKGESLLGSELDSKLSNVEVLELHDNDVSSLSASDVLGITGGGNSILTILGDADDSLSLAAGWTSSGTQEIGGIDYAVYTATVGNTNVELHVQHGIPID